MKTATNRTGYPVIDEILDSIAPTAGHQHDYDPETGSCFCGDVWDELKDEQPREPAREHNPLPWSVFKYSRKRVLDANGLLVADTQTEQQAIDITAAVNSHAELVAALEQFIRIYPQNARRHPDVALAIADAEQALANARQRH